MSRIQISYTCSKCEMNLVLNPATGVEAKPNLDDIILCGGCGTINIITIMGTRPMTDEEFEGLSPEERTELGYARDAIRNQNN